MNLTDDAINLLIARIKFYINKGYKFGKEMKGRNVSQELMAL